jgi:hypothetical protein
MLRASRVHHAKGLFSSDRRAHSLISFVEKRRPSGLYILPRLIDVMNYTGAFVISSSMDPGYRPSSSLYSDEPFFLESLVFSPPPILSGTDLHSDMELVNKIELLQSEVDSLKADWIPIHKDFELSAALACHMKSIFEDAKERITLERNKWLANCTAF